MTGQVVELAPGEQHAAWQLNEAAVPAVSALDQARFDVLVGRCEQRLAVVDEDALVAIALVLGPGQDYSSVNYRWFSARYDDFAYLDRIVVAPSAQRRGLGRALYAEVERRATAPWLCCEVNLVPRNDASLCFHEALGFRQVGEQRVDGGSKHVAMLVKSLAR